MRAQLAELRQQQTNTQTTKTLLEQLVQKLDSGKGTVRENSVPYISVHVHQEPLYGTVRYGSLRTLPPVRLEKCAVRHGTEMYDMYAKPCLLQGMLNHWQVLMIGKEGRRALG